MRKRVPSKGTGRRTVATRPVRTMVNLDHRPLALTSSHDGKRIVAVLPYEVWVLHATTLEIERTIELASPHPSAFAAPEDDVLWLGGQHLHRANLWTGSATKVGTKLGGFVDFVVLIRPRLLCAVGSQGEVLWDTDKGETIHRRKTTEHGVLGLVASADGRAVWTEGLAHAWVIDPEHLSGYMKLKLKATSTTEVPSEAIVCLGATTEQRCILAARDGAIAWTNRALRIVAERIPKREGDRMPPASVTGDERWVYVLRRGNVLQRFLIEQPAAEPIAKGEPEPEPLPDAQWVRLDRSATCLARAHDGHLVVAGPHADNELGRAWRINPEALAWEPLALGARKLAEAPEPAPTTKSPPPSFTPTRSKLSGPGLAHLKVDDVLDEKPRFWVTREHGNIPDRPFVEIPESDVMPADTLLLPAMVRFQEGTARPALLLWPGAAPDKEPLAPQWLVWGDEPRTWIPLETPALRVQKWARRSVFPLQVALAHAPPKVAGNRHPLPERWNDRELFAAMVQECKKLLKVLW